MSLCQILGCLYLNYGFTEPISCYEHRSKQMINLESDKCLYCPRPRTIGDRCIVHHYVNQDGLQCLECSDQAAYGFSKNNPLHCYRHQYPGMIFIHPICQKCPTQANYGYPEYKRKVYCRSHTLRGMIRIHVNH